MEDFSRYQDVMGQLTFLKTYTHIVLGLPTPDGIFDNTIVQELIYAAGKLVAAFPWLAGHVTRDGTEPGKTGLTRIEPYPLGERPTPVTVKDCRQLCPSLRAILEAGGPMSMLQGNVLTDRAGLPYSYDESEEPAPVISIQANFIEGGLLLAFAAQHNIMDMNGLGHMIRLFAKICRGEELTEFEIEQGNRDRRNVVRLLRPDEMKSDITPFRTKRPPVEPVPTHHTPPANLKWVYFHFSGANLATLKQTASSPGSWISTDDALSAFICQRIHTIRRHRCGTQPPEATVTFCRAIDGRRFLETPVPREYMGHMVYCAEKRLPVDDVAATNDLSTLARELRKLVHDVRPVHIHSLATAIAEEEDKSAISYGALLDFSRFDIMFSSWSGIGLYQQSFGVLGKPLLVKRQNFGPMESLVYFMPKTDAGAVDVAVCLRVEDLDSLRADKLFMQYADYIG